MIDGIEYIGNGEFVVTAEKLVGLLEADIIASVANALGIDSFDGWNDVLVDTYPQYMNPAPSIIADAIVGEMTSDE
jgi:hypothetical protein